MVDATKGVSSVTGVSQTRTASANAKSEGAQEKSSAAPVDEVSISGEALSLQQAEDAAKNARAQLEADREASLSGSKDLAGFLA